MKKPFDCVIIYKLAYGINRSGLLLQQAVDHLFAILSEVGVNIRHVYPTAARLGVLLPNQLIEGQVLADVLKPLAALLDVTVDTEVSGLPREML